MPGQTWLVLLGLYWGGRGMTAPQLVFSPERKCALPWQEMRALRCGLSNRWRHGKSASRCPASACLCRASARRVG